MNGKLIFFDIDGTLVSHAGQSHVPEPTIEAIKLLKQNGHVLAIATGRNWVLTRKTMEFFGIDLAVCCNGAYLTRGGECLLEKWMPPSFARFFKEEIVPSSERAYALDAVNIYVEQASKSLEDFLVAQVGFDCRKPFAALERTQGAYTFAPMPREWEDEAEITVFKAPSYTEFRPSGVSKWSGILEMASMLEIEKEKIVTVGDGLNDLEMVRDAPFGIAVGGAKEDLKAVADMVGEDIDEGGILTAFRKLGMV